METATVLKIVVIIGVLYIVYFNFCQSTVYQYGHHEYFTKMERDITPPDGCAPNVDYTNDSNLLCRMWYLRHILGVEMFDDDNDSSQDTFIDSLFPLNKNLLPLYTKPFGKVPDVLDSATTTQSAAYIVKSVQHLHKFMNHTFSQLKDIIDTSTTTFDPYIATCSTQITLASILFEMYRNISNLFFTCVSQNNNTTSTEISTETSTETSMTVLYLMPLMMYLKTHIGNLMESAMIVLNKNNNNKNPINVSSINPKVYDTLLSQLKTETREILATEITTLVEDNNSCRSPKEYKQYRKVLAHALKNTMQLCQQKIKTIKSLTTDQHSLQTIINADLIHIFYRAFRYYENVHDTFFKGTIDNDVSVLKHYEYKSREILTNSQPIPLFPQAVITKRTNSIDTPLLSFSSPKGLRSGMLDIVRILDKPLLIQLTKYTTPGTIGSLFMQILNSKSEILAMPINLAQTALTKYIGTLSDHHLRKIIRHTPERFGNDNDDDDNGQIAQERFGDCDDDGDGDDNEKDNRRRRFMIGNCMKESSKKYRNNASVYDGPSMDLFGDNYETGKLVASTANTSTVSNRKYFIDYNGQTCVDSSGNTVLLPQYAPPGKYNSSSEYLLDDSGNFVFDSMSKPILSTDYKKGGTAEVPSLRFSYPVLQPTQNMVSWDLRGTPDIELSNPPVTGLPGKAAPP